MIKNGIKKISALLLLYEEMDKQLDEIEDHTTTAIMQKQSNNVIPELPNLVTWHYGQNYPFNGCMQFIMEKISYEHTYITKDQINSNKELFIGTVMIYIDKGTPVLVHFTVGGHGNYQVICGYENNGKTLLFLDGDATVLAKLDTTQAIKDDWIFIGSNQPGELLYDLENLGARFNVTLEILQDKEKSKTISDKVREIGVCTEKVYQIMKG